MPKGPFYIMKRLRPARRFKGRGEAAGAAALSPLVVVVVADVLPVGSRHVAFLLVTHRLPSPRHPQLVDAQPPHQPSHR